MGSFSFIHSPPSCPSRPLSHNPSSPTMLATVTTLALGVSALASSVVAAPFEGMPRRVIVAEKRDDWASLDHCPGGCESLSGPVFPPPFLLGLHFLSPTLGGHPLTSLTPRPPTPSDRRRRQMYLRANKDLRHHARTMDSLRRLPRQLQWSK